MLQDPGWSIYDIDGNLMVKFFTLLSSFACRNDFTDWKIAVIYFPPIPFENCPKCFFINCLAAPLHIPFDDHFTGLLNYFVSCNCSAWEFCKWNFYSSIKWSDIPIYLLHEWHWDYQNIFKEVWVWAFLWGLFYVP